MIVIVASRHDIPARRLSERWAGRGACLLTAEDLSVGGWRYYPNNPHESRAILDGREVKQSEIRGVITRLPWVWEGELLDIVSDDRDYVASEMSAFLLCWLSGMACPVVNRPTPGCLNGPGWSRERWIATAAKAGIAVQPVRRRTGFESSAGGQQEPVPVTLTVIGERCLGAADERLVVQARRLADLAEVNLLAVHFSGSEADARFVGVTVCPDIDTSDLEEAVLRLFTFARQ